MLEGRKTSLFTSQKKKKILTNIKSPSGSFGVAVQPLLPVFISLSITEGCDRHMYNYYIRTIHREIYCGISVHLFCDRGSLEFKKMVMSSQSVLGEEKRMKRLGDCTWGGWDVWKLITTKVI